MWKKLIFFSEDLLFFIILLRFIIILGNLKIWFLQRFFPLNFQMNSWKKNLIPWMQKTKKNPQENLIVSSTAERININISWNQRSYAQQKPLSFVKIKILGLKASWSGPFQKSFLQQKQTFYYSFTSDGGFNE